MAPKLPQFDNSKYAVGWIAALPHERAAAEAMLDEEHAPPQHKHMNDHNIYTLGSINGPNGKHNVVITSLPPGRYGTTPAATAATQMLSSFTAVKFGLMVGIGGGIPSTDNDIRLGDIVVSKPEGTFGGVRQYDCGKATVHGFEERGALNSPPRVLLNAMGALQAKHEKKGSTVPAILEAMYKDYPLMAKPRHRPGYIYQGPNRDRLFQPDYEHEASKKDCSDCNTEKEVVRPERPDQYPYIHYGTIASGDQVIKDARKRDQMANNCLCFETEAAGLLNDFPCLVIRGICDYCDTHKNDLWQKYAAATAAAYAKELLQITNAADIQSTPEARVFILQEIESVTKRLAMDQKKQHLDQKQRDVFKWMSPLNPWARHVENQKSRAVGTGAWLFEDPKFLGWFSQKGQCQTLCCYGDPGAGKTIITSNVIDNLEKQIAQHTGLAYIYCDYRDQKEQTTENILGAILKQLLALLAEIPEAVWKLYEERVRQGKPLSLTDTVDLLRITCAQFTTAYICLDALDELRDLQRLLQSLRDRASSLKIFITGRPQVRETIQQYFKEAQIIPIKAHESDIRLYIEHAIGGPDDKEPDAMDDELRRAILKRVVDSAENIFLLPTLQMRSILQAITIRAREDALKSLPSNLSEAFAGTISRIEQQPKALSEQAAKIIAWVYLAERPVTVDELLCSLAIRDGDTFFDRRGMPIKKTLLNSCHGLTTIDTETSTIRLVHYSLEEYLHQQQQVFGLTKAQWHSKIARTCLTVLNFPSTRAGDALDQGSSAITCLSYAATQWGHHLRNSEQPGVPDVPMELAIEYLDTRFGKSYESFHLLYQAMYTNVHSEDIQDEVFAVHIVAFFGIPQLMSYLIGRGDVNVDSRDFQNQTPLLLAARYGREAVVKLLLESGKVDVNSKDSEYHRTPLSWAARNGRDAVVKLLLESGKVDVNSKDSRHSTPMHWAARHGYEAVVKLLLDTGKAEVDSKDSQNQTPLSWAAEKGHEAVMKLLLDTGIVDVDSRDLENQTPLLLAAMNGHDAVVKLLLESGKVDVNSKDSRHSTPMHWAARHGYEAVVKLLLDTGKANVDSRDIENQTPLSRAAEYGHEAVVKLLLDTGKVDVDSRDFENQTPLSRAAEYGHEAVVKLLLESEKVDVDSKDSQNRTPLSWAATYGREAVVKLLLESEKVDVNSKDSEYYGTPLSWAAEYRHEAVVKLLLESGKVDVDSRDIYNRTPLSWVAEKGFEAVVKLLLESGKVDVDSKDNQNGTPLSWAAQNGHESVVKLLLESGKVDVDS